MRAVSADREKLGSAPHQQYLVPVDMTEELSSVGDIVLRKPKRQIRAARLGLVSHRDHPLMSAALRRGSTVPDARDVIAEKGHVMLDFPQKDLKGISGIDHPSWLGILVE